MIPIIIKKVILQTRNIALRASLLSDPCDFLRHTFMKTTRRGISMSNRTPKEEIQKSILEGSQANGLNTKASIVDTTFIPPIMKAPVSMLQQKQHDFYIKQFPIFIGLFSF